MKFLRTAVTFSGVTLFTAALFVGTAHAAALSDAPFVGSFPDNREHTYFVSAKLNSTQSAAAVAAMNYLDSATDMFDTKMATKSANTDVVFWAGTYTSPPYTGWYAWRECNTYLTSTVCGQSTITVNNKNPHSNYRSLLCHEIGHTLGFGEAGGNNRDTSISNQTCMRTNPDVIKYAATDISKINNRF